MCFRHTNPSLSSTIKRTKTVLVVQAWTFLLFVLSAFLQPSPTAAQEIVSYPPPTFNGPAPLILTLLTQTTTVFNCTPGLVGGTFPSSENAEENWLLPTAVQENLTGDFVSAQLHNPSNIYTLSNGVSEGQGYSVSAGPVTANNITQGQTYSLKISGATFFETFVDSQMLRTPLQTQTNTRTLTSSYNILTGVQTINWDYEFEANASYPAGFAGCDSHSIGSETGTASYDFYNRSQKLTIATPRSLPDANIGSPYSLQLTALGGVPPYSWQVNGLPPNLSANSGGSISGTASVSSTEIPGVPVAIPFFISLTVTDSAGNVAGGPLPSFILNITDKPDTRYKTQAEVSSFFATSAEYGTLSVAFAAAAASEPCIAAAALECPEKMLEMSAAYGAESIKYFEAALDPPDQSYQHVAYPSPARIPLPSPANAQDAFDSLITNLNQQIGLTTAIMTAINRAQGAAKSGDLFWESEQMQAASIYAKQLAILQESEPALRAAVSSTLEAAGLNIQVTDANVVSFEALLRGNDLPSNYVQLLLDGSLTNSEIAALASNSIPLGPKQNAEGTLTAILAQNTINTTVMGSSAELNAFVMLNSASPFQLGDVNGDGVVDCKDLEIVKASFGRTAIQSGFDPRADVNKDGVVNILDLSLIAHQLPSGTSCN